VPLFVRTIGVVLAWSVAKEAAGRRDVGSANGSRAALFVGGGLVRYCHRAFGWGKKLTVRSVLASLRGVTHATTSLALALLPSGAPRFRLSFAGARPGASVPGYLARGICSVTRAVGSTRNLLDLLEAFLRMFRNAAGRPPHGHAPRKPPSPEGCVRAPAAFGGLSAIPVNSQGGRFGRLAPGGEDYPCPAGGSEALRAVRSRAVALVGKTGSALGSAGSRTVSWARETGGKVPGGEPACINLPVPAGRIGLHIWLRAPLNLCPPVKSCILR